MKKVYSFQKLQVWQDARAQVKWIYTLSAGFPDAERFGLVNQMRRAAVSVVSNLAEGTARESGRDQARFFQLAYGSLIELLTQLMLSADLNFITDNQLEEGWSRIEQLTPRVSALRNASLRRCAKP